ncbi:MAG: phenylalanine--tRNA ligase subunit beta [Acidobacteriota bacterium]
MRFSHAWLRQYVDVGDDPARVGEMLTAAGIPLDAIEGSGDEAVYDFDILTNRPDCMNHLGLAREYAALAGVALRPPAAASPAGGRPTADLVSITIEAPDLCPRYSARCVLGVRLGPSPEWLVKRLASIGQRSINNVVDVTNFVLWELGHPLHAFDLDRLTERRIIVRRARPDETLLTLDGELRRLTARMLVIADARRAAALAGIIGGRETEISGATRSVLLESAWFDPVCVRRAARALGLRTDASHRFERGADPGGTITALDRAAALIAEVAGGEVSDPPLDVHPRPEPPRTVRFRPSRARRLLGLEVPEESMQRALSRLGFAVTDRREGEWRVRVPTFRRDVAREVDLIEEVARLRGYDAIPAALPTHPGEGGGRPEADRRTRAVRRALEAAGFWEAINYAMIDREECRLFAPDIDRPVGIENPLQSQAAWLRVSLLPCLLGNVAHNLNHGLPGCHLYEIGAVFRPGADAPTESRRVGLVLCGRGLPVHWSLKPREVDLYDARGAVEQIAEMLGLAPLTLSSDRIPFMEEGRALRVSRTGTALGVVGEIGSGVLAHYGIERPVFAAELDLEAIERMPVGPRCYRPLPRFPAVRRDLSLVVRRDVTFDAVERVVRSVDAAPIASVRAFDRYRGRGVPHGCVSLAIQIVFQHSERTLSSDEVQAAQDAIVAALGRTLGATLRGAAES